jgi:hypothetical protein
MQGKATLSKMAAKHPKEAERRVNESLVSTKAATRRKSHLWALLELFGFGHSNKHDSIFEHCVVASVGAGAGARASNVRLFVFADLAVVRWECVRV